MRLAQLAGPGAFFAPLLDKFAVLVEMHDTVVLASAMAIGDENVAGRRDHDVGRLVEQFGAGAGNAGLAEPHQNIAVRVELDHLVAYSVPAARVGHPKIALAIDVGAV